MGEELSVEMLTRMIRKVVREELDRKDNQVAQAVLKLVLDSKGIAVKNEPHDRRVLVAE